MKCPTCRRESAQEENSCNRCGTDLSLLIKLEKRISLLLTEGNRALNSELPEKARSCFEEVLRIQGPSLSALKGLSLAALLGKDFTKALKLHKLVGSASSTTK